MSQNLEINTGEVKVNFESPLAGKLTFQQLGLKNEDLKFTSGQLRMVFDLEGIEDHSFDQLPTIEIAYQKKYDRYPLDM